MFEMITLRLISLLVPCADFTHCFFKATLFVFTVLKSFNVFTVSVFLWSRFNAYYFSLILLSRLVFTIKEEIARNGSVRGGLGILGLMGWGREKAAGL